MESGPRTLITTPDPFLNIRLFDKTHSRIESWILPKILHIINPSEPTSTIPGNLFQRFNEESLFTE